MHGSQVLDKDWRAIDILYDDILDLFYIVNQADTPHDIGLRAFRDHVAAYVDITFRDSVIKFQGRYPVTDQLIRLTLTSNVFTSPPKLTISATPGTARNFRSITQSCKVFNSRTERLSLRNV